MKIRETIKSILGFNRKYPYLVAGYDIRRWEQAGGGDTYVPEFERELLFMHGPYAEPYLKGTTTDKDGNVVFEYDVTTYGPTHLQYKSKKGFLITWPFCFHVWYQFRPKQYQADGSEIPGSEIVWYFRSGLARWDAGDNFYAMGWKVKFFRWTINIPFGSWYGPFNLHWD